MLKKILDENHLMLKVLLQVVVEKHPIGSLVGQVLLACSFCRVQVIQWAVQRLKEFDNRYLANY